MGKKKRKPATVGLTDYYTLANTEPTTETIHGITILSSGGPWAVSDLNELQIEFITTRNDIPMKDKKKGGKKNANAQRA